MTTHARAMDRPRDHRVWRTIRRGFVTSRAPSSTSSTTGIAETRADEQALRAARHTRAPPRRRRGPATGGSPPCSTASRVDVVPAARMPWRQRSAVGPATNRSGERDEVHVVGAPEVLDAVGQQQDALGLQRVDGALVVGHQDDRTLVRRAGRRGSPRATAGSRLLVGSSRSSTLAAETTSSGERQPRLLAAGEHAGRLVARRRRRRGTSRAPCAPRSRRAPARPTSCSRAPCGSTSRFSCSWA